MKLMDTLKIKFIHRHVKQVQISIRKKFIMIVQSSYNIEVPDKEKMQKF